MACVARLRGARRESSGVIATIHHLSATGGSLLSRYVAAAPDVVLVSEVNPGSDFNGFAPLDPFLKLAHLLPAAHQAMPQEQVRRYEMCARFAADAGLTLVLRDHAHADFLEGHRRAPQLLALVRAHLDPSPRSVVTVRNPIDSWLGMRAAKFDRRVRSFEAYCRCYLRFLDHYEALPRVRYEDFCADPVETGRVLSDALGIAHHTDFARMSSLAVTGNSGRLAPRARIRPLPRRRISRQERAGLTMSEASDRLFRRLGYTFDP